MKTIFFILCVSACGSVLAQSNFDPVVADQIRQLKEEQGKLEQQHEIIARQFGIPPTPPPTDAGKVWTNERTGAQRIDRLSPDYERKRAAALEKYQQDLAQFNAAQEARRQNEVRQQQLKQQIEQRAQVQLAPQQDPTLASRTLAVQRYPALIDPNSEFTKKYLEIGKRLSDAHNPIINDPNASERIADMAAGELKILPVR
jgi:hypothetical protein